MALMCFKETLMINLWCSLTSPTRASLRCSLFRLSRPLLNSAISSAYNLPLINSSMIFFPLVPNVSDAIDESFILASSNTFSTLCFSDKIVWMSFLLYLVRSLSSRIPLGGMKLPLSKLHRKSLHNHSLSWTSVFPPVHSSHAVRSPE